MYSSFSTSSLFFNKLPSISNPKSLATENDIRLAYFSGTGNTIMALKAMKSAFEKNGKDVTLFPIEKATPNDFTNGSIKGKTAYGVLFPVLAEVC